MDIETPKAQLQLTWIIDITGSMSSQIEACKKSVTKTAEMVKAENCPVSFAIITYTENSAKSYASYHSYDKAEDIIKFVNTIKLSRPPDAPSVTAGGGDGDENVKAAIARLHLDHDFSVPSIIYFLTDAGYHETSRNSKSSEAKAEDKLLEELGVSLDLFETWSKIDHGNIFFYPMLFGTGSLHTYAQFAKQTGGVCLGSKVRSADLIAGAMINIFSNVFTRLIFGEADPIESFEGYEIYDIDSIEPRTKETEPEVGKAVLIKDAAEAALRINTAMTRCAKVCGKKWTKRKISLSNKSLFSQMQIIGYAMKYLSGEEEHKDKIAELLAEVREELKDSDEQLKQIKLTLEMLDEMKTSITSHDIDDKTKDLVTLATVKDITTETSFEEIKEDFVASVCSALYGIPANIKFQVDIEGEIDFSTSWDAVFTDVGIDSISLNSFVKMIKAKGEDTIKGPTDAKDYNSFVILSGKPGTLRWAIFNICSSLQVLNAATSLGVGAPINQVIPNLSIGTVSRAFLFLAKLDLTENIVSRMKELLVTIDCYFATPGASVRKLYQEGRVSPAENISKLLAVWYKEEKGNTELLTKIIREHLGSNLMNFFKKSTPETNKLNKEYIEGFYKFEEIIGKYDENLEVLHPFEQRSLTKELIHSFVKEGKGSTPSLAEVSKKLTDYLSSEGLKTQIKGNKLYKRFHKEAVNIWSLLNSDTRSSDMPEMIDLEKLYPEVLAHFAADILLRARSQRYNGVKNEKNIIDHQPKEMEATEALLFQKLRTLQKKTISEREKARAALFKNRLLEQAKAALSPEKTTEEWVTFLSANKIEFNGKEYTLKRFDLIEFENIYNKEWKNLLTAILIGEWTTEVPQVFRRTVPEIKAKLLEKEWSEEDIEALVAPILLAATCTRKVPNRKGHKEDLTYPGPTGWSQEYHDQRITNGGRKKYLLAMKRFTLQYKKCLETEGVDPMALEGIACLFHDAFAFNKFMKLVKKGFPECTFEEIPVEADLKYPKRRHRNKVKKVKVAVLAPVAEPIPVAAPVPVVAPTA